MLAALGGAHIICAGHGYATNARSAWADLPRRFLNEIGNGPEPAASLPSRLPVNHGLAFVLASFFGLHYLLRMPDLEEKLSPADPEDLAASIAFALKFEGRKRWHDADALMADIVAKRLIRYLERARFVVMKRPPIGGSAPLNTPASYPQTKPEDLK